MAVFNCRICGAPIETAENTIECKCSRCGYPQKAPQSSGAPAGDKRLNSILMRGQLFLKNSDFSSVIKQMDEVLKTDPECGAAYWLIFLAEKRCPDGNFTELSANMAKELIDSEKEPSHALYLEMLGTSCQKALDFSEGEEYEKYSTEVKKIMSEANAEYERLLEQTESFDKLSRRRNNREMTFNITCPVLAILSVLVFIVVFPLIYTNMTMHHAVSTELWNMISSLILTYWPVGVFCSIIGICRGINGGLVQSRSVKIDRAAWSVINIFAAVYTIIYTWSGSILPLLYEYFTASLVIAGWNLAALAVCKITRVITDAFG